MANVKFTEMADGAPADGSDILAISKSAAPRRITVDDVVTFALDEIAGVSTTGAVESADKVYILDDTDGTFKPVAIDVVLQRALDTLWGKGLEASPDSADIMALLDGAGSTEKTITLPVLAEYVRATIEATILELSSLGDGSGSLAVGDLMLITQGGAGKKITVQDLYNAIYAGLAAYVEALDDIVTGTGSDRLYMVRGGAGKYITLTEIAAFVNATATIGGSGTTNQLAQWSNSTTLKAGPAIVESFGVGSNIDLPTSKAVRDEMSELINDTAAMSAAIIATDTILIDDGAIGTTQRKATFTQAKTFFDTAGVYKTIYVPAALMHPRTTDGAAAAAVNEYATNDICLKYFAFGGGATEEAVQFAFRMPEDWNLGTIKAKFDWSSASGSTSGDTVEWGLKAGALDDDDTIDAALGTEQVISDALLADNGTKMQLTGATPAITVGGTPALGALTAFEAHRNTDGTDDMTEDGWLFGVWIQYLANVAPAAW